jgi:uncharacterized membrane protein YgcG
MKRADKNIMLVTIGLLIAVCLCKAQPIDCNEMISDEAHIISNPAAVQEGASVLVNQGADVHVITVANMAKYGPRLNDVEAAYERNCPSWLSPAGKRKANLFVLLVAPKERKKNAFFGEAYVGALHDEDTVNTIYSRAANPFFQAKQWPDGFAAALRDFGNKVVAFHDQQQHPASVTNQATDLKPVAYVMMWILGASFLGFLLIVGIVLMMRWYKDKREREAAQQDALNAMSEATNAFNTLRSMGADKGSLVGMTYNSMSSQMRYDPNDDGLTAESYKNIAQSWRNLASDIKNLTGGKASVRQTDRKNVGLYSASHETRSKYAQKEPVMPEAAPPASTPAPATTQPPPAVVVQ